MIIGFVALFLLFGGLRWSNIAHRADPPAEPEPKPG